MAIKYFYNNAGSEDPSLLSNWWDDAAHESQSISLPLETDDIFVDSNIRFPTETPSIYNSLSSFSENAPFIYLNEGAILKTNIQASGCQIVGDNPSEFSNYPSIISGNVSGYNVYPIRLVTIYGDVQVKSTFAQEHRFAVYGNLLVNSELPQEEIENEQTVRFTCDIVGRTESYGQNTFGSEGENGSFANGSGQVLILHDNSEVESSRIFGDIHLHDNAFIEGYFDDISGNVYNFSSKPFKGLIQNKEGYSTQFVNFNGDWQMSGQEIFRSNVNSLDDLKPSSYSYSGNNNPSWTFREESENDGAIPSGEFFDLSYCAGSLGTGKFFDESECRAFYMKDGRFNNSSTYLGSQCERLSLYDEASFGDENPFNTASATDVYVYSPDVSIKESATVIGVIAMPFSLNDGTWKNSQSNKLGTILASGITSSGAGGGGINGSSILGMI